MYNINLARYGRFTKKCHNVMKSAKTQEELDNCKRSLVRELRSMVRRNILNSEEFTRLRFRLSQEYIERVVEL